MYPFSRGSSRPRNQTRVSYMAGRFLASWATGKPSRLTLACQMSVSATWLSGVNFWWWWSADRAPRVAAGHTWHFPWHHGQQHRWWTECVQGAFILQHHTALKMGLLLLVKHIMGSLTSVLKGKKSAPPQSFFFFQKWLETWLQKRMHDCRVLTHHSAATAQPRAEAGWRPGASVQKPCPAQVVRAGRRQLKAFSSVLAHSPGSSLGGFLLLLINMCCDLPVAEILNTSLHSPDPFVSVLTGCFSPPFLHGAQSIAHLLSLPLPPWPFKMFSSSICCDREAVQQRLDGSNPKGTPNTSSRALSRPQGHSSRSCSG